MIICLIVVLPYLVYIPVIVSTSVSGINLYKEVISNRRKESLHRVVLKHIFYCIIMLVLMSAASIFESYMLLWIKPMIIKFL